MIVWKSDVDKIINSYEQRIKKLKEDNEMLGDQYRSLGYKFMKALKSSKRIDSPASLDEKSLIATNTHKLMQHHYPHAYDILMQLKEDNESLFHLFMRLEYPLANYPLDDLNRIDLFMNYFNLKFPKNIDKKFDDLLIKVFIENK
jgi:hypothetical protein